MRMPDVQNLIESFREFARLDMQRMGAGLSLRIRIEGACIEVDVRSVVVSQRICPERRGDTQGMGVRFSDVSPEVIEKLSELYAQEASLAITTAKQVATRLNLHFPPERRPD